ncbi:MAG: hypothetical protein WCC57_13580 [Paracoccaceae bacterium]
MNESIAKNAILYQDRCLKRVIALGFFYGLSRLKMPNGMLVQNAFKSLRLFYPRSMSQLLPINGSTALDRVKMGANGIR